MITAPTNWKTIWDSGEFDLELRFTIDGTNYYNDSILSTDGRLTHYLYNSYGIGNACIGKFTITLIDPQPIARGVRQCTLACRLKKGTTTTAWVPQGTFYLNTVEKDSNGHYKLGLYDGLALCDVYLYTGGVVPSSVSYPRAASTEIRAICTKAGITAPSDLSAFNGMQVTAPTNMTCRQILQSLAAAAGGNFIMAKDGRLKFIPLANHSGTPTYYVSVSDLKQTSDRTSVTGVSLRNKEETIEYGSDSGIMVAADCVYATQTMVTNLYTKLLNRQYQGYTASGAYLSPLCELGDYIEIEDSHERFTLDSYTVTYEQGLWGTITAPMKDEVEQRIAYQTDQERKINELGTLAQDNAAELEYMSAAEYISDLIGRINEQANETGGYTYIVEGQGLRTYDVPIDDLSDDSAAHSVVEIKGGTIRIANSRNQQGQWNWKTVFTSGHIAADLVTAANIVTGFIGNPSGNYWNLDTGELRMSSTTIQEIADSAASKINVGGTNLLIDSNNSSVNKKVADANRAFSFSSGLTNKCSIVSLAVTARPVSGAQYAFQVAYPSSSNNKSAALVYYSGKAVKLIDGQQYTISCWAKRSGGSAGIFFQYGQTSWKASTVMSITGSWKRYSFTFTFKQSSVGGSNGARIYFYTKATSATSTTVQIAGMKLETGSVATDWSVAPEENKADTEKSLSDAKAYANALNTALDQEKIAKRLFGWNSSTNKYKVQGIAIKSGQLYINGSYITSGSIDAKLIKAGILSDKKGKYHLNMSNGSVTMKDANLTNAKLTGSFQCGTTYKLKLENGTLEGYRDNKKQGYIDATASSRNLQTGKIEYGMQFQANQIIRISSPKLAIKNSSNVSATAIYGWTGTKRFDSVSRIVGYSDGTIQWWTTEHGITCINGIVTSVW